MNPQLQNSPTLVVKDIQDVYVRQNFKNLQSYFNQENQLLGFNFFEIVFTKATTNYRFDHALGLKPEDIIMVQASGPRRGGARFNIGLFSTTQADITVTAPCRLRFFIGSYWNFVSSVNVLPTAFLEWSFGPTSSSTSVGAEAGDLVYSVADSKSGWLLCDGTLYVASDYQDLAFALWDTTNLKYKFGGSGSVNPDGSMAGSFNVPPAGYFLRGVDHGKGNDPNAGTRTVAATGGNTGDNVGSVQADATAVNGLTVVDPGHDHQHGAVTGNLAGNTGVGVINFGATDPAFTGISLTGDTETRPLNMYANLFIKT